MDSLTLTRIVASLVLPPGSPILIGLIGLALLPVWQRAGVVLLGTGTILAYLASIPLAAGLLHQRLQEYGPVTDEAIRAARPEAIVVLAGGLYSDAPEYGDDTVALRTLGRVRYAAQLARRTGLPVLASGGARDGNDDPAEGELMVGLLRDELGIRQVHVEQASQTTRENAFNSAPILRSLGYETVLLVTNAAHMRRSMDAFRRAGIRVVPAPTLFFKACPDPTNPESWVPVASAMREVHYALHEYLGRLWYRLLDGVAPETEAVE